MSREHDPDWYEACNPLLGTRGLVPVKYFHEVGKTVRDSAGSSHSANTTHDSGYAEGAQHQSRMAQAPRSSGPVQSYQPQHLSQQQTHQPQHLSQQQPHQPQPMSQQQPQQMAQQQQQHQDMPMHRASKSVNRLGGVYGIVSYDFHAERPDELDAKAGEAIIVIAQSNPEWFVAKPITRLGGPGLIPVSFIEIRDMASGVRVDDAAAAVAKAGIPRVEDWKRMAAEYKNTSIPLGQVSTREQASLGKQPAGLQQGMERMSLNQQPNGQNHQRNTGNFAYQQQQAQNLYAPVRASVPKFTFADDKFHFVVECRLSNGTHWDLSRIYEDFYELQINLINAFPEEAGQVPGRARSLPYMPGPVKFVTDNITEGRRANLDEYLRDLLKMAPHITNSSLVRNFFHPRDGDYEVDPSAVSLTDHARAALPQDMQQQQQPPQQRQQQQQQSQSQPQQDRRSSQPQNGYAMDGYGGQDQQRAMMNGGSQQYGQMSSDPYGHQRGQNSLSTNQPSQQQGHARSGSQYTVHSQSQSATATSGGLAQVASHTSNTSLSMPSNTVNNPAGPTSMSAAGNSGATPVKVKAWFDRDTCVVIRMPARGQFSFDELYRKIAERRRLEFKSQAFDDSEELDIEYRDEKDGEYYRLEGDEDLEIAVERNEKLTLAVRAARQ